MRKRSMPRPGATQSSPTGYCERIHAVVPMMNQMVENNKKGEADDNWNLAGINVVTWMDGHPRRRSVAPRFW
jgi:hypothetical protein